MREYLKALGKHGWWFLISVVGGTLGLGQFLATSLDATTGPMAFFLDVPKWVWWPLIGVGLVLTQFLAWRDMRTDRDDWKAKPVVRHVLKLSKVLVIEDVATPEHSGYSGDHTLGLRLGFACMNMGDAQIDECKMFLERADRVNDDGTVEPGDSGWPSLPTALMWRRDAPKVNIPVGGKRVCDLLVKDALTGKDVYVAQVGGPQWHIPDGLWSVRIAIHADGCEALQVQRLVRWESGVFGSVSGVLTFTDA